MHVCVLMRECVHVRECVCGFELVTAMCLSKNMSFYMSESSYVCMCKRIGA